MTEPLRHDRQVDAGGEHERRLTVAQVMQPHPAQSPTLFVGKVGVVLEPGRVNEGTEQLGDVVGAQRVAVLAGEHETVVGVRLAPLLPLGLLP
ncbi:hypothetical protein NLY10_22830 [Streptomyces sp. MAR25Y5]|nr:hypothetical protein [Streptomyces sp. MAR25Y5]MCP3769496.1 hypothetical protein [Streptomyces sp. MAR25Y5]